ncbi:MAG TPA: hypothetical protein IGQ15_04285 [Thermosynechococcus sp. M98_K2018_005]|uniref:hypothetical protein n=1 Tax=Thermosynechococcus sp. M98_K2018_005 TaxID=2747811 RepID=UPI001A008141|nr:hypothetical protein [Thermosynechococcus sp. M98_K2018_005]HIK34906.1 hypothetical protein [Thermosynechococcus sp. M98_K2018_005]
MLQISTSSSEAGNVSFQSTIAPPSAVTCPRSRKSQLQQAVAQPLEHIIEAVTHGPTDEQGWRLDFGTSAGGELLLALVCELRRLNLPQ